MTSISAVVVVTIIIASAIDAMRKSFKLVIIKIIYLYIFFILVNL